MTATPQHLVEVTEVELYDEARAWIADCTDQLPADWDKRRHTVKARANNRCEWVEDASRCTNQGTECDHIERGNNHDLNNLQWLCTGHHKLKTQLEAAEAHQDTYRRLTHPNQRALPPGLR